MDDSIACMIEAFRKQVVADCSALQAEIAAVGGEINALKTEQNRLSGKKERDERAVISAALRVHVAESQLVELDKTIERQQRSMRAVDVFISEVEEAGARLNQAMK
jgi:flagellar biosynthesis chaperone FliJ